MPDKTTPTHILRNTLVAACLSSLLLSTSHAQNALAIPPTLTGNTFDLTATESTTQFLTGNATMTWGFNQSYLGPTLIWQSDEIVKINVTNDLDDTITVHWHGLNVQSEDDGGPHTIIPGSSVWSPTLYVHDSAATMWYHSHVHGSTLEQVTMGLAGMLLIRDAEEATLGIPLNYGTDEFPIILQDRDFRPNNQLAFGPTGDTMVVNGTIDPELAVPAQVVRFRLLNGSNSRFYNLGLSDGRSYSVIGRDGGLFDAPVSTTRIVLAPGQRADVLVDFGSDQGSSISLMSYASEMPNSYSGAVGPGTLDGADFAILALNVGAATDDPITSIPATLATYTPLVEADANGARTITMAGGGGGFTLNGNEYEGGTINETVIMDAVEIWTLTNNTNLAHPFHIHDVQFYVLDRDSSTPGTLESGKRQDTVLVNSGETVRVIMDFINFGDPTVAYMYHCHILNHEDDGMMGQFIVVDPDSPWIDIADANGNIELCWTGNLSAFSLQKSTNLDSGFTTVADGVTLVDGDYEYTEATASGSQTAFRLAMPGE